MRHLEQCVADLITITDAYGVVRQSFDREVLAELAMDEVRSRQLLLPVAIGLELVDEDGAVFAAVTRQVALTVSFQIQAACAAAAAHAVLPDRRVHDATVPLDVSGKANVYREQSSHIAPGCELDLVGVEAGPKVRQRNVRRR